MERSRRERRDRERKGRKRRNKVVARLVGKFLGGERLRAESGADRSGGAWPKGAAYRTTVAVAFPPSSGSSLTPCRAEWRALSPAALRPSALRPSHLPHRVPRATRRGAARRGATGRDADDRAREPSRAEQRQGVGTETSSRPPVARVSLSGNRSLSRFSLCPRSPLDSNASPRLPRSPRNRYKPIPRHDRVDNPRDSPCRFPSSISAATCASARALEKESVPVLQFRACTFARWTHSNATYIYPSVVAMRAPRRAHRLST